MKKQLHIVKIGGNVIDDPALCNQFLKDFSDLNGFKILVHGGGKLATAMAEKIGIKQTLVDGRRITDAETLDITVMVYAGLINKRLSANLQANKCNAIGLSGSDGNIIRSTKRRQDKIDFGFVGDIALDGVNTNQFINFLDQGLVPVISPITHDGQGILLNTNADTIATAIALALKNAFDVSLTFCFEKKGVLKDVNDDNSFVKTLDQKTYLDMKAQALISKGMIPKLDNSFRALEEGIRQVTICHAENIKTLSELIYGTQLVLG